MPAIHGSSGGHDEARRKALRNEKSIGFSPQKIAGLPARAARNSSHTLRHGKHRSASHGAVQAARAAAQVGHDRRSQHRQEDPGRRRAGPPHPHSATSHISQAGTTQPVTSARPTPASGHDRRGGSSSAQLAAARPSSTASHAASCAAWPAKPGAGVTRSSGSTNARSTAAAPRLSRNGSGRAVRSTSASTSTSPVRRSTTTRGKS
jgi:hypothetical protein